MWLKKTLPQPIRTKKLLEHNSVLSINPRKEAVINLFARTTNLFYLQINVDVFVCAPAISPDLL